MRQLRPLCANWLSKISVRAQNAKENQKKHKKPKKHKKHQGIIIVIPDDEEDTQPCG